jgi:hypothetical protein
MYKRLTPYFVLTIPLYDKQQSINEPLTNQLEVNTKGTLF